MIDFSLTAADERLIALSHEENEIGRRHAREQDRTREKEKPRMRGTHPDVEDREWPYDVLNRDHEETSGLVIAEVLMRMASAQDAELREDPHEAFGSGILQAWGTDEQKAKYGHLRLAIGLSEPEAGSDPGAMRSTAVYDEEADEYILNGEKTFISFINKFDGAVALVRNGTERSFSAFIVLHGMSGFEEAPQMKKLGVHKHDLAGFSMSDLRVPAIARLDADFGRVMSKFNHNRPIVAAVALGTCRSMLDFTRQKLADAGVVIDYSRGRGARSAAEDRLVTLEALFEAAVGTVLRAKWLEHRHGTDSLDYRLEASVAKAIGGKAARQITQGCLDLLGPMGISEHHLAEKWLRDARIADIYEGAGEIQRILIAREVLGYKRELN